MKKENKSLVNHVLINNFSIIIAAVIIVFLSLLVTFCAFYRSTMISQAKTQLNETVSSLKFLVAERIQQSDYIIRDSKMLGGLNTYYDDNYELMKFTTDFGVFANALTETESIGTNNFTVYTENPTLMNSGYIVRADSFEDFDKIRKESLRNMQFFCWDKEIKIAGDEPGQYLTLYRYVDTEYDFIVEMKLFTDNAIPDDNIFGISVVREGDYDSGPLVFASELSGGFEVVSRVS